MPRPPRLLLLPPAPLRTPASPKASRSRSRIRLHGPDGIGKRRPRSTYAGGNTSGFPPAGPNLAWLAGEIKRLAFPAPSPALHTPAAAAAAAAAAVPHSSSQQRQPPPPPQHAHHPAFFPTPVFPLRSRDITFLGEPREFYETILERIRGATSRVTLSALYLGTGELERRLVQELVDACRRRPGLRVRVLLDHSRAQRGGPGRDSLSTLAPLLRTCPGQAEVALFRMPQLATPLGQRIPSPLNEVVAVSHLKALAFDDALLLTGANLSDDYFTQRQDRYVLIQNAGALAAFYHEAVGLLARFANATPSPPPIDTDAEPNSDSAPSSASSSSSTNSFPALARELRRLWGQPPFSAFNDDIAAADTLALPTLQCAPLGIRHEDHILRALLKAHPALALALADARLPPSPMELTLATAYLNPPPPLLESLGSWPGPLTLLAPAAAAHGFAGASGLKSWIPLAYLMHEHRARQHLAHLRRNGKKKGRGKGGDDSGVHVLRYARPGWTFHGKGIWMLPTKEPGRASPPAAAPRLSITVAGSSNYGVRSFERDLESQVLFLSRSPDLAARLAQERQLLLQHCEAATAMDAAAREIETELGAALEYPWRQLWLPRLAEWTREYL